MLTTKECMTLLEKHGITGHVLRHILRVNQVAVFLGLRLKEQGEHINIDIFNAASLLHDIGKKRGDDLKINHVSAGVMILEEEGYPELAEIISKHSINAIVEENIIPTTWEEKIVYYADRRAKEDELVSIEERISDLRKRYPDIERFIETAEPKIQALENEIFNIIKIDKELIELKNQPL